MDKDLDAADQVRLTGQIPGSRFQGNQFRPRPNGAGMGTVTGNGLPNNFLCNLRGSFRNQTSSGFPAIPFS
jgi:hypothetical protein